MDDPDDPAPLPLRPGPVSNGEFVPAPASATDTWIARETLDQAERIADRLGMDRRRFLQSAGGVAAMLTALNVAACSAAAKRARSAGHPSRWRRRHHRAARSSRLRRAIFEACEHALGGSEFIFDVHTHHVMPDRPWRPNAPETVQLVLGMLPPEHSATDPLASVNRAAYVHDMFMASDTTVALLTDVPNSGASNAPIPFADAVGTQEMVAQLAHGGASRVVLHDVIAPNFGGFAGQLDDMSAKVATGHVAAFKVYTAWGPNGQGFDVDDPRIGLPVLERARKLGVKVFCSHKGLPLMRFDAAHNGPRDMVAAAKIFPDMQFVIFHAAWDPNYREGPYDPANSAIGINSLLKALDDHGVKPNSNVWVDLGTTWRTVLTDPDQAAHVMGKLLSRVGEDRVLWGTDAIWYGSPQPQIMAFRAFQISAEYQERFGYPALTAAIKAKVLGLNAAEPLRHRRPRHPLRAGRRPRQPCAKAEHSALVATGKLPAPWQPRGPLSRRQTLGWLARFGNALDARPEPSAGGAHLLHDRLEVEVVAPEGDLAVAQLEDAGDRELHPLAADRGNGRCARSSRRCRTRPRGARPTPSPRALASSMSSVPRTASLPLTGGSGMFWYSMSSVR